MQSRRSGLPKLHGSIQKGRIAPALARFQDTTHDARSIRLDLGLDSSSVCFGQTLLLSTSGLDQALVHSSESLVFFISSLELSNPSITLVLLFLFFEQVVVLGALLAIFLPVSRAGDHGEQGEALSVDTTAEHAVGLCVVTRLHGFGGFVECPYSQTATKRDKRFFDDSSAQLLPSAFLVKVAKTSQTLTLPET